MASSVWLTPGGIGGNGATITFPLGTQLTETALGILAMVSSAAANQLQIPNGSNAEYVSLGWASNVGEVGTVINGGTGRNMRAKAGAGLILATNNGTDFWTVSTAGNMLAATDNTPDIGAAAATRPKNIIAATRVTAPAFTAGASAGVSFGPSVVTSLTVVNGIVTAVS